MKKNRKEEDLLKEVIDKEEHRTLKGMSIKMKERIKM